MILKYIKIVCKSIRKRSDNRKRRRADHALEAASGVVNRKLASPRRAKVRTLSVQPVPARRAPQRGRTRGDQDARSSVAPRLVRGETGHGREQHDGGDINPPAQLKTSQATLSRAETHGR